MKPWVIFLAGPNGSGKSTLANTAAFAAMCKAIGASNLNPDDIAKSAPAGTNPIIWSGRELHRLIDAHIRQGKSFVVETTLSGQNHFQTLKNAKPQNI